MYIDLGLAKVEPVIEHMNTTKNSNNSSLTGLTVSQQLLTSDNAAHPFPVQDHMCTTD